MRTEQRKARGAVIERPCGSPHVQGVTGLARLAFRFEIVRVAVTRDTRSILKEILMRLAV